MSNAKTFYVYDSSTREVMYTINNPTLGQIESLRKRGILGHLDEPGISILNKVVIGDTATGQSSLVELREKEDYIIISDDELVSNGTHRVIVSNLNPESTILLYYNNTEVGTPITVSEDNNFLVFDSAVYSPERDHIKFSILEQGYFKKDYYIPIVN